MTRSRTRSKKRTIFNIHSTFFDMSEMSMLSSSGHPEMWTVESGSESILPLKEHRVAWKKGQGRDCNDYMVWICSLTPLWGKDKESERMKKDKERMKPSLLHPRQVVPPCIQICHSWTSVYISIQFSYQYSIKKNISIWYEKVEKLRRTKKKLEIYV